MPSNRSHQYYVYLTTNKRRTLYTGFTNNLHRRMYEHKRGLLEGFTKRYRIISLAYYEETSDAASAIAREKQIKGWLRSRKVALIEGVNAGWEDLSLGWFDDSPEGC